MRGVDGVPPVPPGVSSVPGGVMTGGVMGVTGSPGSDTFVTVIVIVFVVSLYRSPVPLVAVTTTTYTLSSFESRGFS